MTDPFWSQIYDSAKDRRYAKLFFVTILAGGGLACLFAAVGQNLDANERKDLGLALLPAAGMFAIVLGWKWNRSWCRRRGDQLKCEELSRDELAKARLKLKDKARPIKGKPRTNSVKRTAPRALDTYLRY